MSARAPARIRTKPPTYKRRPKSSKGFFDQKYSIREIANHAMSTAAKVAKLINVEKKLVDTTFSAVSMSTAGQVDALCLLAEGDTELQRNGLSVKLTSNYLQFYVHQGANATKTHFRIMLIKAFQPRGSAPAVLDILETASVISPLNHIKKNRFKVLLDKLYTMSSAGDSNNIADKFYSNENFHIKYNAAGGAIGQVEENGLFLLYITDEPTSVPVMNYYNRLRFIDN